MVWWRGGRWRYYEHGEKKKLSTLSKSDIQDEADILYARCCKIFKNGYQIQKLIVMSVREPTADGDSMLWVENIRGGRVVDDDGVFQVSSDFRKVLDVVAAMVVATLPKKTVMYNAVDIKLIQQRIAILSPRG